MSSKSEFRPFLVSGFSMWPLFKTGDPLLVEPLHSIPRPGDVIVFKLGRILVCHRFFGFVKSGDSLLTKTRGDACFVFDIPVEPSAILGRVVEIENSRWRTEINRRVGRLLTGLFSLRDAVIDRLGLTPGSLAFALVYMGMTPWLYWIPKGPQIKSITE